MAGHSQRLFEISRMGSVIAKRSHDVNSQMGRRTFLKAVGALLAIVFSPIAQLVRPASAFAAKESNAFRFVHDETVSIVLDFARSPERYDLEVRRGSEVLATFRNAHPMRFDKLKTEYFTVEYFAIPATS